jgi:hypothetical protein
MVFVFQFIFYCSLLNARQLAGGMRTASSVILWGGTLSPNAPQLALGLFTRRITLISYSLIPILADG